MENMIISTFAENVFNDNVMQETEVWQLNTVKIAAGIDLPVFFCHFFHFAISHFIALCYNITNRRYIFYET